MRCNRQGNKIPRPQDHLSRLSGRRGEIHSITVTRTFRNTMQSLKIKFLENIIRLLLDKCYLGRKRNKNQDDIPTFKFDFYYLQLLKTLVLCFLITEKHGCYKVQQKNKAGA